jgi:small-conductance mechanosensitive channel
VSLGYEVDRVVVEKHRIVAAQNAGLGDPFVEVVELGDFSISYRAAGFLTEIKHIITTRSNLRKSVLDSLHAAEIEIVSPTFMNQRQLSGAERFVPAAMRRTPKPVEQTPEARIFDKADAAEAKEKMHEELTKQQAVVAELEAQLGSSTFEAERSQLDKQLVRERQRLEALQAVITDAS